MTCDDVSRRRAGRWRAEVGVGTRAPHTRHGSRVRVPQRKPRAHKIALLLSVVALAFGTRVKARTCSPLSRVRPTACEACDVSSILITRCIFRFGHDGHVFPRGLQERVYDTEHLRRNTVRQMRRTRSPMRLGTRRMKAAVSSDVTCVRLRPTKTGERYYRAVAVQLQRNRFG